MCRAVRPAPPGPRPPPPGGSRGGAAEPSPGSVRPGSVRLGSSPAQQVPRPGGEENTPSAVSRPRRPKSGRECSRLPLPGKKTLHNKQVVVERRDLRAFTGPKGTGRECPRLSPASSHPWDMNGGWRSRAEGLGHLPSPAARPRPSPARCIPRRHSAPLPWKLPSQNPSGCKGMLREP